MKLISLNTYGGKFFKPLLNFIKKESADTDIFCFQEVLDSAVSKNFTTKNKTRANLFPEFTKALPEFRGFFAPAQDHYDADDYTKLNITLGLAVFIRKKYAIKETDDFFICRARNSYIPDDLSTFPFNLQYVRLALANQTLTICNLHGTSEPGSKLDSPERITQSQKILDFANSETGEKIITGDFNLLPNTKSIALFEEAGFHNLIKEFNIKSTRGSLIKKLHPEYGASPEGWQEFADYTFTSTGIKARKYSAPDLPLSDHLPLIMEFDLANF